MQDLHAAIALYTHGIISRAELREIASVYYKVPLGKTDTTTVRPSVVEFPFSSAPYTYPVGPTSVSGTLTMTDSTIEDRPTKCACKHD